MKNLASLVVPISMFLAASSAFAQLEKSIRTYDQVKVEIQDLIGEGFTGRDPYDKTDCSVRVFETRRNGRRTLNVELDVSYGGDRIQRIGAVYEDPAGISRYFSESPATRDWYFSGYHFRIRQFLLTGEILVILESRYSPYSVSCPLSKR